MRTRRSSAEHQEAVARRLELLGAELEAARADPGARYGGPGQRVDQQHDQRADRGADPGWGPGTEHVVEDPDVWWAEHTRVPGDGRPALRAVPAPVLAPVPVEPDLWEPAAAQVWSPEPTPVPTPELAEESTREAPSVPVPGRHAARRGMSLPLPVSLAALRSGMVLVPDTLRGRASLGSAQVAVVATLVAAGLAVTCWWVVKGDPEPAAPLAAASSSALVELPTDGAAPTPAEASGVPSPAGTSAAAPAGAAGATGATGAAATTTLTVDVAGKVRHPGIAVLPPGARVVDAIEAAGGPRAGVDLSSLNLARLLVDGEQILVGQPAVAGAAVSALPTSGSSGSTGGAVPGTLVNLNTATEAQLDTLPDVGPVTAQSILAWRDEHGGFTSVDELLEVSGIGDATLAKLAPFVTV